MENHTSWIAKLSKDKGNIAFKAEDYATAISLYSHAIAWDRSNHLYSLNRSQANLKLERWDEAEADATKALDLCPRNLKALLRRGRARKGLGKWDHARADIQMFIDNKGDPALGAQELKDIADAENSLLTEPSSCISGGLESDLADLCLQDDSNSSIFSVHTSAAIQNGKGAFASRDIQRGDLVLSEKPIFCIPASRQPAYGAVEFAVRNLSPNHLDGYLSLHNSHNTCSCFSTPLMRIFCTNAMATSDGNAGICLEASRFNHSCSPNAKLSFNSNTGDIRIYALRTIPRGEEIFYSYIGPRLSRQLRQTNLHSGYHFTCACSLCSLPEAESQKSDARRQRLNEILKIFTRLDHTQEIQFLNLIAEGIRLLQEEGCSEDAGYYTIYAGPICAFYSDWVSTGYWASLTYHTSVAEYGEDSPQAAEVRELYLNPKSFRFAGLGPPKDLSGIRV